MQNKQKYPEFEAPAGGIPLPITHENRTPQRGDRVKGVELRSSGAAKRTLDTVEHCGTMF